MQDKEVNKACGQRRHVKICHTRENLWELPPGPRVVMASVPSLDAGMSLQLLVDWAPNPNNLIVFPGEAPVRTMPGAGV